MASILASHEIGEGFPVLIIHGWQLSGEVEEIDFEPVFKASGLLRIYVDLPGMGNTPANGVKDQDEMFQRLCQFIDSRLGSARFAVGGSSCGGYLARAVAQKYIDQVDGLLLRVPLIEPNDKNRDVDKNQEPLVANKQVMASIPAEGVGFVPIQTPAYVRALKSKFENVYDPAVQASDSEVLDAIRGDPKKYALSFSLDKDPVKFPAPTLIVCGRHDDAVGYRDSLRLLEFYPRSTFAVLDRATHGLPVDEGGLFEALVRDWIVRVEEWRGRKSG